MTTSHGGGNNFGGSEFREQSAEMTGIRRNVTVIVVLVIESLDLSSMPLGGTFNFHRG